MVASGASLHWREGIAIRGGKQVTALVRPIRPVRCQTHSGRRFRALPSGVRSRVPPVLTAIFIRAKISTFQPAAAPYRSEPAPVRPSLTTDCFSVCRGKNLPFMPYESDDLPDFCRYARRQNPRGRLSASYLICQVSDPPPDWSCEYELPVQASMQVLTRARSRLKLLT